MTQPAPAIDHPSTDELWCALENVADPEIPVISVVDLGVVRELRWCNDELIVTVTPTYCGCPAMEVMEQDIRNALRKRGVGKLRMEKRLAPAWSTDWMSDRGKDALRAYGIAPPEKQVIDTSGLHLRRELPSINCPRCGSAKVSRISQFGSTPCKALYRCNACLEPLDYFKSH